MCSWRLTDHLLDNSDVVGLEIAVASVPPKKCLFQELVVS